jgi:nucleolar GTP-binding protein
MDYKYLRWQVIDTPGILDHPLEDRNTIEMQAVTALAHLNCVVLFFVDISGQSDYTIEQQVSLFKNIHPLFAKKPVVVVASKTDVRPLEALEPDEKSLIDQICISRNLPLIPMSNISEEGIFNVKTSACELLMEQRMQAKIQTNKVESVLNRIHVAMPKKRDSKVRESSIPDSVLREREMRKSEMEVGEGEIAGEEDDMKNQVSKYKRRTLKDVENENGGAGVFNFNHREHWQYVFLSVLHF